MPDWDRQRYAPSGRFDAGTLLVHGLLGLGLAALLACGLAWIAGADGYAVGWLTFAQVVVFSAWVRKAVYEAKCRHPLLAALGAGALGLALTVAHFHIDQCSRWGVGWERLDRLPGYVAFRMETDGWWAPDARFPCRLVEPANPAAVPWLVPIPRVSTNWAVLFAELVAVGLVPAVVGWRAASRPFDETVGEWCVRDRVAVTPESARLLREALAGGDVLVWVQTGFQRSAVGGEHVLVEVWYTPRRPGREPVATGVYLGVGGRRPVALTPEEAAALATVLPEVATLAAVPEELEPADSARPAEPHLARLTSVGGEFVGRAKNPWVKYLGRALAWGVAATPLVALAGLAGFAFLLHELGVEPLPLMVVIMPLALGGLVYMQRSWLHPDNDAMWRFLVWYYRGVVRRQARARSDALFDVDDPHAGYAEMVPRRAWSGLSEHAHECEGGITLIDETGGRLLFEGDRYRYEIPFAAIEGAEVEELGIPGPAHERGTTAGFYAVVVTVRVRQGSRELPLCTHTNVPGRNRWEKAVAFHQALLSAIDAHAWGAGSPTQPEDRTGVS